MRHPALGNESSLVETKALDALVRHFEDFCKTTADWGYDIRPYSPDAIKKIKNISASDLKATTERFTKWAELNMAVFRETSRTDNKTIIWRLLRENHLRPTADLFSHLRDEDIVEVYGADGIQIFCNMRFFDYCTYSLADIFAFEWPEMFERESDVMTMLAPSLARVFSGHCKTAVLPELGWQKVREVFSADCCVFEMENRVIAPLYDSNGAPAAVVAFSGARVIGSNKANEVSRTIELDPFQ